MEEFKSKGNLEYKNQNYTKALEYYEEALKIVPDNAIILSNKAATLIKLNKPDEAVKAAAQATKKNPHWPKAWNRLISALILKGDLKTAKKAAKKSLIINPNNTGAKELLKEIKNKEFETFKKQDIVDTDLVENAEDTEDTEDEDEDGIEQIDTTNVLEEDKPKNVQPNFNNQFGPNNQFDSNKMMPMMNQFMQNDKLKSKIYNPEFQQKILKAQNNPFSALSDPDIMEVMQEMMKSMNMS